MKGKFPNYSQVPVIGRFRFCLEQLDKQNLKNKVLVDVGSSTGLMESKLVNKGLKKIIGVEPYEEAVNYSKKNIKGVEFHVSTADKLPVKDNSIDIVTMFDVIEHVPQNGEMDAFQEVNRILKKGGIFLLTTPHNNLFTNLLDPAWYLGHRHYKPDDMKKMIEKLGFKVKRMEVRGSIWSSIYMLWFYVMKWIFGQSLPRNKWIERKEDEGYNKEGIFTLFIESII
ncbi:class I SAM-dependent methyltransferase [Candidatus Microgenomates bacterium]|nr:class I SAM-dependent methyltransferase [Candidatus Microgenomates bacterium]